MPFDKIVYHVPIFSLTIRMNLALPNGMFIPYRNQDKFYWNINLDSRKKRCNFVRI